MRSLRSPLVAASLVFCACDGSAGERALPAAPAPDNKIEIKGSDSEVNLVQRMAEAYMAKHPDVQIAVTGGGSGAGIASLIDGTADLANSSREMRGKEKVLASRNKVDPVATVFATDALSVVVHRDNPVEEIGVEQLGQIFAGEVSTWDALGGTGPISAYGRQSSSGTYSFFRDAVVKEEYGQGVREMNGNAQIVEGVGADVGGIGYVAVGYAKSAGDRVKVLPVIPAGGGEAVSPLDAEAVRTGRYPIARSLYQLTDGAPSGALRDFLLFELSPEGEAITVEMGFYPVMDSAQGANDHLKAK